MKHNQKFTVKLPLDYQESLNEAVINNDMEKITQYCNDDAYKKAQYFQPEIIYRVYFNIKNNQNTKKNKKILPNLLEVDKLAQAELEHAMYKKRNDYVNYLLDTDKVQKIVNQNINILGVQTFLSKENTNKEIMARLLELSEPNENNVFEMLSRIIENDNDESLKVFLANSKITNILHNNKSATEDLGALAIMRYNISWNVFKLLLEKSLIDDAIDTLMDALDKAISDSKYDIIPLILDKPDIIALQEGKIKSDHEFPENAMKANLDSNLYQKIIDTFSKENDNETAGLVALQGFLISEYIKNPVYNNKNEIIPPLQFATLSNVDKVKLQCNIPHTALRYLFWSPNELISPNAIRSCDYSSVIFDDDLKLISIIWNFMLNSPDPNSENFKQLYPDLQQREKVIKALELEDGVTIETVRENFIKTLATLGRLHNIDKDDRNIVVDLNSNLVYIDEPNEVLSDDNVSSSEVEQSIADYLSQFE